VTTYKRGKDFPAEQFVQVAIEAYFLNQGFNLDRSRHVDLACVHPITGERWQIESKGISAAIGLDFRTGLGQLLQRMTDRAVKHGVAVPKIPQYEAQISKMTPWVVDLLGIHWFLIRSDGSVEWLPPNAEIDRRNTPGSTAAPSPPSN